MTEARVRDLVVPDRVDNAARSHAAVDRLLHVGEHAPAHAGETGPFYRAELAAPAAEARPIAAGVAWFCNDDSCAATKGTSRPVIVCARLVKEVGPVASFTAGGEALDAAQLAKCNGQ